VIDIDVVWASARMSVSIAGPSDGSIGRRKKSVAASEAGASSVTP
jgi:hypothetical protein